MSDAVAVAVAAAAAATPWVSILTPVYNGWEYLEQCAASIFMQHLGNPDGPQLFQWEWIIGINGHGTSGGPALERARAIKTVFERAANQKGPAAQGSVRIFNLWNLKGKVPALNELVNESKGKYIALLDCDDTWERDKLLQQWLALQGPAKGADVIGTHCYYFGDAVSLGPALPCGWIPPEIIPRLNPLINSSVLIRRPFASWIDRFGLEDYDLWFRVAERGGKMYNLKERLVHHRIHAGSAFNGKGVQDVEGLRLFYTGLLTRWPVSEPPKTVSPLLSNGDPATTAPSTSCTNSLPNENS